MDQLPLEALVRRWEALEVYRTFRVQQRYPRILQLLRVLHCPTQPIDRRSSLRVRNFQQRVHRPESVRIFQPFPAVVIDLRWAM